MPKSRVNGVELHYLQAGAGSAMVMVHGGAANLAFWYLRVVPMLADRFRITAFDLRGHGLSQVTPDGYAIANLASDLEGLLDHLGIERVHLVGHSLGGAISLHFAALHPRRVATLSLVDARVPALQPLRDPDDLEYWARRKQELIDKGVALDDDSPRVVYALLDEIADAPREAMLSTSPWDPKSRAARQWRQLVTTTSFATDVRAEGGLTAEVVAGCQTATLLSYGADSHCLTTCRALERLLPNHHTVIHDGVGHFFPLVAPALAADDVRSFVEAAAGTGDARSGRAGRAEVGVA